MFCTIDGLKIDYHSTQFTTTTNLQTLHLVTNTIYTNTSQENDMDWTGYYYQDISYTWVYHVNQKQCKTLYKQQQMFYRACTRIKLASICIQTLVQG